MHMAAALSSGVGSDGDVDLLDGDHVHDSVLGVGRSRDDLALRGSGVLKVGRRSDGGGGGGGGSVTGLDIVNRDTATPLVGDLGPGRGVRLRRHRCGRGGDGDGHGGLLGGTGLERSGVLGAVLDGDVAAKAVGGTITVVDAENLGHGLDLAGALLSLGLEVAGEVLAVLDTARGVGAVVDGSLEGVDVPAVDEISVVSVAWFG
jgi:hypothetical protein